MGQEDEYQGQLSIFCNGGTKRNEEKAFLMSRSEKWEVSERMVESMGVGYHRVTRNHCWVDQSEIHWFVVVVVVLNHEY